MVIITARYIKGKKNIMVDQLSHPDQGLPTEHSSLPRVFDNIIWAFGHPLLDLFATRVNMKLPVCVTPILVSMALKEDVFQHVWDNVAVCIFHLFILI